MTARKKKEIVSPPKSPSKVAGDIPRPPARKSLARGFSSGAWERVYLMSVELESLAHDVARPADDAPPGGFNLGDAAQELARLAANYNRDANPDGRTPEQEKEDWVTLGGVGADLGNMADEGSVGDTADEVRAVAHELCYLACDYLF